MAPCQVIGETVKGQQPIFSPDACLPDKVRAVIKVNDGVRQLQMDELGKAKGVPME